MCLGWHVLNLFIHKTAVCGSQAGAHLSPRPGARGSPHTHLESLASAHRHPQPALNLLQLGQWSHPHPPLLSASLPEDSMLWEPLQHRAAWKFREHKNPSTKMRQELAGKPVHFYPPNVGSTWFPGKNPGWIETQVSKSAPQSSWICFPFLLSLPYSQDHSQTNFMHPRLCFSIDWPLIRQKLSKDMIS